MDRRKTERLLARIPIRVSGVDELGKTFVENTSTVEVNRDGARIALKTVPRFGVKVEIANRSTQRSAAFVVTHRCPQSYSGLPEWGVEFSDPVADFWGVAFDERTDEEGLFVSALLRCTKCGRKEMVILSGIQPEALGADFSLARQCADCLTTTDWQTVATEDEETAPASLAETMQPQPGAERRGARRLTLKVPVMVTTAAGASGLTKTQGISKTGLCLSSGLSLDRGDPIQIVLGYGVAEMPTVRGGRVVWAKPTERSVQYLYGIPFIESP